MALIDEIKKEGRERQAFIDTLLAAFAYRVADLERWLYDGFYDDFVKRVVVGGRIGTKESNIAKINNSPFWGKFYKKSAEMVGWILDNLVPLINKLTSYFDLVTATDTSVEVRMTAQKMLDRLGYNGKEILRGGYFDTLINDVTAERRVKRAAIQAIVAGKSLKEFQSDLNVLLNIDKQSGRLGVVSSHYQTNANTLFAEFDRAVSFEQAKKYGLGHALWSGPQLTTTRAFCKSKKGKVFTIDQINAMDAQTWQGKIPGQATIISAGGYNCVDLLLWITDGMAEEMQQQ